MLYFPPYFAFIRIVFTVPIQGQPLAITLARQYAHLFCGSLSTPHLKVGVFIPLLNLTVFIFKYVGYIFISHFTFSGSVGSNITALRSSNFEIFSISAPSRAKSKIFRFSDIRSLCTVFTNAANPL